MDRTQNLDLDDQDSRSDSFQMAMGKSFGFSEPEFVCDMKICEIRPGFFLPEAFYLEVG